MLARLLAGDEPRAALAVSFPGRFSSAEERELWWQTGCHHLRDVPGGRGLEAAESRRQLEQLGRFIFAAADGKSDVIVPLRSVLARSADPVAMAELTRRGAALKQLLPALHPFYRNAGLSLADVFEAGAVSGDQREARWTAFERDWKDATELEAASKTALDRLEAKSARR